MNKIFYCLVWSFLLFFVTLYGFLGNGADFVFESETFGNIFGLYIMPMIMAMALYLWDVMYAVVLKKSNLKSDMIIWVLVTLFIFMLTFALSMFVNRNWLGWVCLIISWMSFLLMKIKTTEKMMDTTKKILEE